MSNIIYRIQFRTEDKNYDLYVRHVYPSDMNGFICIEGFTFLEENRRIIDPRAEKLNLEFGQVETAYIPYHQILRIDQVKQIGESKISEQKNGKITPFPHNP